MALITEIRKSVADATPVYAAVGVSDLAVHTVRTARARAARASRELTPEALQKQASKRVDRLTRQLQDAPAQVLNRGLEVAGRAQGRYDELAERGEDLVRRIREQRATKELIAQVDQTVAASKGAVTTVRKTVTGTRRSARATVTTGRHEAGRAVEELADTARADADTAAKTVKASATRTRTAARRTTTTARKGAAAVRTQGRSTATRARKTAAPARKAAKAAAGNVGS
jgi:heparin binding hemagglutinin HbhA